MITYIDMPNMPKVKVAFFETEPWEIEYLKLKLKDFELMFFEDKLGAKHTRKISRTNILSPFIYSRIDKKLISSLPQLKYIATRSTGFDHIDVKACLQKIF